MSEADYVDSARIAYDHSTAQFVEVVGTGLNPQFEAPLDRAVLEVFSQQLAKCGRGLVADIGCGPGRVAAYLAESGLEVWGFDISERMIEAARVAHPDLRFEVGSLTDLPVDDGSVVGAAYWYSIIATPLSELALVWGELDRVLAKNGRAIVAFQSGENAVDRRPDAYGSGTELLLYHHRVDDVIDSLTEAGFTIRADIRRQPELQHETTCQAALLVQRN